jgi:hypothetical protein
MQVKKGGKPSTAQPTNFIVPNHNMRVKKAGGKPYDLNPLHTHQATKEGGIVTPETM